MEIFESTDSTEQFPYPVNITREDFADVTLFDPDEFLFKHHRYTSLDSLLSDLRSLSKSLNQDLLDLVNNEYTNFIQLGQSIGSCLELIENLSVEVGKFKASLSQTLSDFADSSATCAAVLQHKRSLNLLKNKIKLVLLLHEQCVSFETLVALDVADLTPTRLELKLHTLTTLHLSISKMYSLINESLSDQSVENSEKASPNEAEGEFFEKPEPNGNDRQLQTQKSGSTQGLADGEICYFFDHVVKTKVLALKVEFKLYLDELLVMTKSNPHKYEALILSILHTYRVLGMSSEAVRTLKTKN